MASKATDTGAAEPIAEPIAEAPAPEAPAGEAEPDPEPEAEAEAEPEPLPTHIAMRHSDGGSCDAYEADKAGIIQVPVAEIASLLDHGFVPAASE